MSARKNRNLGILRSNLGLKNLARSHSSKMAKRQKIWHGDGVYQAKNRITKKGILEFISNILIPYSGYSGENVAMLPLGRVKGIRGSIRSNRDVAKAFHKMWMKSPGHKRNILNSRFSLIGIGIKKRGKSFYATQIFYG